MTRLGCMATSAMRVEHTCYINQKVLGGVVGGHSPVGMVAGGRQTTTTHAWAVKGEGDATLRSFTYSKRFFLL